MTDSWTVLMQPKLRSACLLCGVALACSAVGQTTPRQAITTVVRAAPDRLASYVRPRNVVMARLSDRINIRNSHEVHGDAAIETFRLPGTRLQFQVQPQTTQRLMMLKSRCTQETDARVVFFDGLKPNSVCTGVVVGPNAILTSAHCVSSGTQTTYELHISTLSNVSLTCRVVSGFKTYEESDCTADGCPSKDDAALCVAEQPFPAATGAETLDIPQPGPSALSVVGFLGCEPIRQGPPCQSLPIGMKGPDPADADPVNRWFMFSTQEAPTCGGDSGAPWFAGSGANLRVVGVHGGQAAEIGHVRVIPLTESRRAEIADLHKPQVPAVCGIGQAATGCR